jgi:hypothetical protein
MKAHKTLDCVQLKDSIQAQLLQEWKGMSDEEIESLLQRKLRDSQSAVARLWRRIQPKQKQRIKIAV